MITYEKKEITVPTRDGERTITAMVASNGLAYHLCPHRDGNGPDYSITHVPTGRIMNTKEGPVMFDTRAECCLFIERVDSWFDWTKGEELRVLSKDERRALSDRLLAMREEIVGMALF